MRKKEEKITRYRLTNHVPDTFTRSEMTMSKIITTGVIPSNTILPSSRDRKNEYSGKKIDICYLEFVYQYNYFQIENSRNLLILPALLPFFFN